MVGDWLKGTRGMRAEARGVYLGLLLHQFEVGWIPSDLDELALIEPEVGKVWVSIKDKFEEVEPGKLRNKKLVEVLSFWEKQRGNGLKGGRPPKEKPKENPKYNPNSNPKHNHHNDLDHDTDKAIEREEGTGEGKDLESRIESAFVDTYLEPLLMNGKNLYPGIDIILELQRFRMKVSGSPRVYAGHDTSGLRLAFEHQLRSAKPMQPNGKSKVSIKDFLADA